MGRLRKRDAKREEEILAAPPVAARDWAPVVDKLTNDPARRAVILSELAALDELERSYRPYTLRGNAGAGKILLDVRKVRDRLLALSKAAEKPPDPAHVDIVNWVPMDDDAAPADDVDLNDAIAESLERDDAG